MIVVLIGILAAAIAIPFQFSRWRTQAGSSSRQDLAAETVGGIDGVLGADKVDFVFSVGSCTTVVAGAPGHARDPSGPGWIVLADLGYSTDAHQIEVSLSADRAIPHRTPRGTGEISWIITGGSPDPHIELKAVLAGSDWAYSVFRRSRGDVVPQPAEGRVHGSTVTLSTPFRPGDELVQRWLGRVEVHGPAGDATGARLLSYDEIDC